jgi:uncharacterized membrane protein
VKGGLELSNQLLLALFENEAAADEAVKEIKLWDKASEDIRLGAIGVIVKDDKGKIKTHKLGERRTVGGALLFGLAGLLTGGAVIGLGLLGGIAVGAGVGSLFRKGLKMSKEEMEQLNQALDGGKAAVGVMAEQGEVEPVSAKLKGLGGVLYAYEVTDEAVESARQAAQADSEAPAE